MGCSTSKDVESPVKRTKEGWDTVLPKGFAVQVDRSIKSTEAGYIAALFSTNYGNMRNSPVKSDDLSLSKKPSGIFRQSKVSKAVGGDVSGDRIWSDSNHGGSLRKPWSDLKVGVPKLGSESKLVTGATRSRQEQAETINTWELMQGLEDDTESLSLNAGKPLLAAPSLRPSSIDKTIQAPVTGDGTPARSMPLSTKLIDLPVSTSSAVPTSRATTSISRIAAAPPRPKSFNSIRSIEEVDAHFAARRSRTPPPVWRKKSKKIQAIRQPGDDHLRRTTDVSGPSSSSLDPIISTVSAREEASAIISNEPSDWNPNNLQRALSFKYIFNNDGSEGIDFIQSDKTSTSDYAACLTGSSEYDGPGFRPRPEFSGVASLKDWLPVFGPPNQPDAEQTGVRHSLLGAIEGCSNSAGESSRLQCEVVTPSLLNSKRVHSIVKKYGGSNDQLPRHSPSKGTNTLSSDTEGDESPVLDPEVLESFEKASEKLSEKEWYAMTKLESESESPRDFVHLMRSQRRSSSNSVEGLETPTMEDKTAAILTEKKVVEDGLKERRGTW